MLRVNKPDFATQTEFSKSQKEAIVLLSIGTFLEYFDLMLYVHMAVLLNDLFFPKTDQCSVVVLSAFAFCSTYVMRPFGAVIFGIIGDNIGRKTTLIITTSMMSCTSMIIAILPTYSQIGLIATVLITICRIVQGISSMAEKIGAEIYLTEITKPPKQYFAVTMIDVSGMLGTLAALGVATLSTYYNYSWRYAFMFGSLVSCVAVFARSRLKESAEFLKAKLLKTTKVATKNLSIKTCVAMFFMQSSLYVYVCFILCGNIMVERFAFSSTQVIYQNFLVSIPAFISAALAMFLCVKIYPLTLIKITCSITLIFSLFLPYLLNNLSSSNELFLIQIFLSCFVPSSMPAGAIFYKYFPTSKRFTYTALIIAVAKACMACVTSVGLAFLIKYFGNYYPLLFVMLPLYTCFYWALTHFTHLEKQGCLSD